MRVITGSARGRRLTTLKGDEVRPTTDKVKEALFSVIQFQVEGRRALDLFSGSGQLGIEALSRGAASCVFVDANRTAMEVTKKNLEETGLSGSAQTYMTDSLGFLERCDDRFDLVFLDPPYGKGLLEKALFMVVPHMNSGGTILCESAVDEPLPDTAAAFVKAKVRRYGGTALTIYSHRDVIADGS